MHRVGLSPSEYSQAFMRLCKHSNVAKMVLMSHFANADNVNSQQTSQQVDVFKNTVAGLNSKAYRAEFSLANSAAILAWPITQASWSRPGIMLYGADPLMKTDTSLRAVMQLNAEIISIRHIQAGESIGYGNMFTAMRDTIVGVVACGYADGYPRAASNLAPVAVDGQMTKLIGRVSMDMLFVDLTDIVDANGFPSAKVGSSVELWGDLVPANDVAKAANTIAYELFCNVKRVQFQYSDS
jgi:alanine racemase